jgi:hypothetical protein
VADTTDPQLASFDNLQVRPMADLILRAYWQAKQFNTNYINGGIGALITAAGGTNNIGDGSATDGRTRITGNDILNLVTAATDFIAYIEGTAVSTTNRLGVISKPHVNA